MDGEGGKKKKEGTHSRVFSTVHLFEKEQRGDTEKRRAKHDGRDTGPRLTTFVPAR